MEVTEFAYSNKRGGTELAYRAIKAKVVKKWDDDECGWRYHGMPIDDEEMDGKIIYFSEFDITTVNGLPSSS